MDEIITDRAIDLVWGNANFGGEPDDKRLIVDSALLKKTCGYSNGHTAECIIKELGLVDDHGITKIGKAYLYEAFVKDRRF